jgi:hypothetical protein
MVVTMIVTMIAVIGARQCRSGSMRGGGASARCDFAEATPS